MRSALHLLSADPAVSRLGLRSGALRHLADADTGADPDPATARRVLRALLTVRDPGPLPEGADRELDALLGAERRLRPAVPALELPTLVADAVVNAANSQLLGCFRPQHPCIDDALHNPAGPRLREDCHTIMTAQGALEPTGTAKITRGYHLPARYVLHTVADWIAAHPGRFDRVVFTVFGDDDERAYRNALGAAGPPLAPGLRTGGA